MEIKGKTNVFVNTIKAGDKDIVRYATSISSKKEDGNYDHMSLELKFAGKNFPESKLSKLDENHCYKIEIKEGFLSFRTYVDKNSGKTKYVPQVVVTDAKVLEVTELSKPEPTEADMPW